MDYSVISVVKSLFFIVVVVGFGCKKLSFFLIFYVRINLLHLNSLLTNHCNFVIEFRPVITVTNFFWQIAD